MSWLSETDVQSVLTGLRGLYESADVDGFAVRAGEILLRLVPADRCSYSEFFREPGACRILIVPSGEALTGSLHEALGVHGHQNPLLSYYRQTRRAEVVAFSDFVTPSQLHRIPLYNEYYRHVEVEHQIIVPLSFDSARARDIGFALSRRRTDFSERDRQVLEMMQPHLIQAHANAMAVEQMGGHNACLEGVLEASGRSAVILSDEGSILFATSRSWEVFREYFGGGVAARKQLPGSLARWVKQDAARQPLMVVREGKRLTVRLLESEQQRLLLLEQELDSIDPQSLAPLGLTRRQSEVLAWVAQGKTNEEIAAIAGARPATVAKHLERIYQKLGVETRTAAAIEALSVAGKSSFGSP